MTVTKLRAFALSIALAAGGVSPSHAAMVTLDFSGVLTSAVNNVFDDPDLPSSDFFQVGQAFSGSIAYDTNILGSFDGFDGYTFDLQKFDISIGGVDFSSRFLPREIYRSTDGSVSFTSGGADQGGGASLDLSLASYAGNYPKASELTGKTASFSFNDFYPLGGEVSGLAYLVAEGGASTVPEPGTWLFMVLGLGTVGYALRRRRPGVSMVPAPAA